jgi:hypothetical protein
MMAEHQAFPKQTGAAGPHVQRRLVSHFATAGGIVLDQSCVDRLEVLVLVSVNAFRSDLARNMLLDQLLAARRLFT